eukprot:scaffold32124_cov77-Phaeocystis_antarctica.AAC.1
MSARRRPWLAGRFRGAAVLERVHRRGRRVHLPHETLEQVVVHQLVQAVCAIAAPLEAARLEHHRLAPHAAASASASDGSSYRSAVRACGRLLGMCHQTVGALPRDLGARESFSRAAAARAVARGGAGRLPKAQVDVVDHPPQQSCVELLCERDRAEVRLLGRRARLRERGAEGRLVLQA